MSRSTILLKLACTTILLCIALAIPVTKATVSCSYIKDNIGPCLEYLESGQRLSSGCCPYIRKVNSMGVTKADRKSVCECMKSAVIADPGILGLYALALPGKCGVPNFVIPRAFTDCSKIN
ncbi:hypothetical protein RND81_08G181800 [Saponaria officinalis]|uniref:Non-specific lipid-transfer protein n=1 Tax=Saponaria officinalis TaxID=3572 RepID=A0AAW1J9A0_SAPOF